MDDLEATRRDLLEGSDSHAPDGTSKARPATEQAVAAIMNLLTSGELGPGDRLPTERDLALGLGVSRSTVREAIRGLEMMRVLQVRHGEGIFVTSLDAPLLLEATGFALQLMRDHEVVDLLELRAILEGAAAGLASARMTDEQRRSLLQRLEELDAASNRRRAPRGGHRLSRDASPPAPATSCWRHCSTPSRRGPIARVTSTRVSGSRRRWCAAGRRTGGSTKRWSPETPKPRAQARSAHVANLTGWLRSVVTSESV